MKIAILGCGWLGLELGKILAAKNHTVRGSVTSLEKISALRQAGIIPYSIKLFEKGIQGDIKSFLSKIETLIIDIPPGLRKNPEINFVEKIRNLIPYMESREIKNVIFISSTTVYEASENVPVYTEEAATDNKNDVAVQLRNVELLLLNNPKFNTTVLRFGGLLGPQRHPVNTLAGQVEINNPTAPVNLIHRKDCIRIIEKVLEKPQRELILNAVYPEHPKREKYYQTIAAERNLEEPKFDHSAPSKGKMVSSKKIIELFRFKFENSIWED